MSMSTDSKRITSPRQRATTLSTGQMSTSPGYTTVFTRLQGLFPTAPQTGFVNHTPRSATHNRGSPSFSPAKPRALKVRILTWNMHDSVPKGDLEELLGKVPLWNSLNSAAGSFPNFPLNAVHPYHLVVVAGQECPSLSGMPMGLGAGFKFLDKDKDKDRDREKDREYDKPRYRDKEKDDFMRSRKNLEDGLHETPSGWTSMIEDWLCQGSGSGLRTGSPTVADVGSPRPLSPRLLSKEPRKGPYQLLIKERMMGIYLAVYIHRDVRSLVRGTSRSAVAAGLIGGRVGNKGGVGITINLDGTTFLFLNAHLAAHEGKIRHRLANLAKIKAELSVDDFLSNDDPRIIAEDLTDKFDYTFLFGDLNFRLDITRLHADWLMSRKEYAQALAFDQLKKLMETGKAFVGFREAPINFPPTFKYDVLKGSTKRKKSKFDHRKQLEDKTPRLTEVEQKELRNTEEAEEEGEGGEAASITSSAWTSAHSKAGSDGEYADDDYLHMSPSSQTMNASGSKISVAASSAVNKAKTKWLSLLSPSNVTSARLSRVKQGGLWIKKAHITASSVDVASNGFAVPSLAERALSLDAVNHSRQPPPMILISSTKSTLTSDDEEDDDKGVYDSSHKKRVPSWCDRILWKSTVLPDPELGEDEILESHQRPRNRVGQFLANAFRPLSARIHRDSIVSDATVSTLTAADSHDGSPSFLPDIPHNSPSPSQSHQSVQGPNIPAYTKSTEDLPTAWPSKSATRSANPRLRRANSAILSLPSTLEQRNRQASGSSFHPNEDATDYNGLGVRTKDNTTHTPTPFRWRFLPSFLSYTPSQSNTSIDPPIPTEMPPPTPRKGDVVCLDYNTLDDRGMRKLEGRSDHRPVIGSYTVYL